MTEQLKPCPFCGNTDLKSGGDDKIVGVWCENCQMAGPNHYGGFDWNTRPSATPGNTDPMLIAKYDDELRKVQGGHKRVKHIKRGSTYRVTGTAKVQTDRPLSDYAEVVIYQSETDGHVWARPVDEFEDPDRFESLPPAPTEHPTEQPVYETCSKCSGSGQIIGDAGEPTLCSECKGDAVVASEQPSVRDAAEIDLSGSVLLEYQVQRGDAGLFHLYGSDGVFVSRKSIQECLEALPVLRKEMQAALRSLAQEGE